MFTLNRSPENRPVGFTLEIRSQGGELWFLRGFPVARAKDVVDEIMSIKEFWSGGWKLIIRPYNERTDRDNIGSLQFLYKGSVSL